MTETRAGLADLVAAMAGLDSEHPRWAGVAQVLVDAPALATRTSRLPWARAEGLGSGLPGARPAPTLASSTGQFR